MNTTGMATALSSPSQGLNWHIYPSPLSCINKCSGRLRSISVSISRFTCSALSQQGSECSSVKCLITGAVGREGRRLDIKTLAFWKSDMLLTRVLLSQRRDLVSADCSLVLGTVFLQGSCNRGPLSLGGSWGLMGWSWVVIDTHRPATDDLTVMAAGCGHCMLVISAGAPIRSLELSIPDSYRNHGHLSVYCVAA